MTSATTTAFSAAARAISARSSWDLAPLGERAVAGHIERRHVGGLEHCHRLAHRLGLVDPGGVAEQRGAARRLRQPVAGLAPDRDQERIDLRHRPAQSRKSSLIAVFDRVRSSTRLTMTAQ